MKKQNWVWMPHPGHFICSHKCRFHLNTYVGGYIVSTVGELWLERESREIIAEIEDPAWLVENKHLKGDAFDNAYMKRFGFERIGAGAHDNYETMVFKANREPGDTEYGCCPYVMESPSDIDGERYQTATEAYKGHLALCHKWANKKWKKPTV